MARPNHGIVDHSTFKALDDMPSELRREVCFAYVVWDAKALAGLYADATRDMGKDRALNWLAASIHNGDERDVFDLGRLFKARYRIRLPHLAAEATILRYQPPVERRNAHRKLVIPLRMRKAWRATERLMPREGIDETRAPLQPENEGIAARFAGLDLS